MRIYHLQNNSHAPTREFFAPSTPRMKGVTLTMYIMWLPLLLHASLNVGSAHYRSMKREWGDHTMHVGLEIVDSKGT